MSESCSLSKRKICYLYRHRYCDGSAEKYEECFNGGGTKVHYPKEWMYVAIPS